MIFFVLMPVLCAWKENQSLQASNVIGDAQASSSTATQLSTPSDLCDAVTVDNPVPALQEDVSTYSDVSTGNAAVSWCTTNMQMSSCSDSKKKFHQRY